MRAILIMLMIAAAGLPSGLAPARAAAERVDPATLSGAELRAMQQQLTAARCYEGSIDGQTSPALTAAIAKCPDQRPQLRIETGMHVATINRISADAKCSLVATASDDKTIRLWSPPDGAPGKVLRPPIGAGDGGKVFATAVSPDGRFVAAGGWDAYYEVGKTNGVTIYDVASGEAVARVGAFPNVINHLTFSHDGRWLAVALAGENGVRIVDTSVWRVVAEDKDYGGASYGAAFGPDNRLYTTSEDRKIRRYAPPPGFALEPPIPTHGGKEPFTVAIDPAGERIAVGHSGSPVVEIYDAATLSFRAAAETASIDNGDLIKVAWTPDGRTLLAGGRYDRGGPNPILRFDRDGHLAAAEDAAPAAMTIMDIQPCASGVAVAAADPAFGLYADPAAAPVLWKSHVIADLRGALGDAFTISPDARRVRFGLEQGGKRPLMFDLDRLSLSDSAQAQKGFLAAKTSGLPVENWRNNYTPTFAGKPITLKDYERSRSLAILPKNAGFVLGTEWSLRGYDAKGVETWPAQAVPSVVWGVNVSADGRLIVAAYGDGTIRWHRMSDGKELLAFFVHRETREWVLWTPSGYYAASTNGENLIGWHVNRGWDQAADFFPASKFRDIYARPDIVSKILVTLDEAKAISAANAARTLPAVEAQILDRLPPVLTILSPKDGATATHGEATVEYLLRSPSGLPVDEVAIEIGGQAPTREARALDPAVINCLAAATGEDCKGKLRVYVPSGTSEVNLSARAGDVISAFARLRLVNPDPPEEKLRTKPKLVVLSIGVSHYADSAFNLRFADKDATDFASTLLRQKGGNIYDDVEQKPIADGDVKAVRDGFEWLKNHVGEKDVAVVFFAGHGAVDENQNFYFLAADSRPDDLRNTAISGGEIINVLKELRGRPVLFLDACHAGASASGSGKAQFASYNSASVVNSISVIVPHAVIFASSDGSERSEEDMARRNGAFTAAVIEGLVPRQGKAGADMLGDGKITPSLLDAYVAKTVSDRTNHRQNPKMQKTLDSVPVLAEAL